MNAKALTALELLQARERRSYLDDGRAPLTDADAAALVAQRGLVMLGADSGLGLPSLSAADPEREWSVSWRAWRWKETLPAAGRCAYLKWFRGQGTFVAWHMLPHLYALWGPRGRGGESAELAWQAGALGRTELDVLAVIEAEGPISSRDLWLALRGRPAFGGERRVLLAALAALQKGLYVSVSGGDLAGWSMHHWNLLARIVPEGLLDRLPSAAEAQRSLAWCAVANLVVARPREVGGLFGWRQGDIRALLDAGVAAGELEGDWQVGRRGGGYALRGAEVLPGR